MKAKSSLLLFVISALLAGCFDSPEYSTTPEIITVRSYFGKARDEFSPDSLVVEIDFKDGDGDLGLDANDVDEPFHPTNFFIARNGTLIPVGTKTLAPNLPPFLSIPPGTTGKLAVLGTRSNSLYTDLMTPYESDSACIHYSGDANRANFAARVDSVLVYEPDAGVINETSETYAEVTQTLPLKIFVVKDTFYVRRNPAYQNIQVRFFRKDNVNSAFEEIDFYKLLCQEVFEGRFPLLSDKENAVQGTIKYSMKSTQFENVLNTGIWQLEITIRDRANHVSKPVKSREFSLQ